MTRAADTAPGAVELARQLVANNIEAWGWGPLADIDGLAEHDLAVKAATAAFEQQAATIAELREALEPVSTACEQYVAEWRSDSFPVPVYLKAGDLRRARTTLNRSKGS